MADSDKEDKTEAPSGKKLEDARGKGQIVLSRELSHWFVLAGAVVVVVMLGPPAAHDLTRLLRGFLVFDGLRLDDGSLGALFSQIGLELALIVLVPAAVLLVAAIGGTTIQTRFLISAAKMTPNLAALSPLGGLKRIFSLNATLDLAKNLMKLGLVGGCAWLVISPEIGKIAGLIGSSVPTMVGELVRILNRLMIGVLISTLALAAFDWGTQRYQFMKNMRMSKEEVKEEQRQSDGDPKVKGKQRQIRFDRARRRMMTKIPTASVVITNPTHFAVALRYEAGEQRAPVVVAKGADLIAANIRKLAKEHDIPIVENPPVARALFAAVELDHEIPPEHYKAVAEIIGYVYRLRKRKVKPAAPAAARVGG